MQIDGFIYKGINIKGGKMKALYIVLAGCLVFLAGCESFPLQSGKRSYVTESISKSVYSVTFCGNAYMDQAEAEKLATQRACELALTKGYTHFVILEKSDKSEICSLADRPRDYSMGTQPSASFVGPQNLVRPNLSLKIECYPAKDAPDKAIDAQKYLDEHFPGLKFTK